LHLNYFTARTTLQNYVNLTK